MERANLNLYCVLFFSILFQVSYSQTEIPGGNVSGIWNAQGSPYLVKGDIVVPAGQTLVIEAGVEVKSDPNSYIIVNGRLRVYGANNAYVKFTASDTADGWGGIQFQDSANDDSRIVFAEIYYAYKGIDFNECAARVDSSILAYNTFGIYGTSNMMSGVINDFSALEIYSNETGFIAGWTFSSNFYNCKFYNNSSLGVFGSDHSGELDEISFDRCLLYRNGAGITNESDRRKIVLKNCTVTDNVTTEVLFKANWYNFPVIENTIIWGDEFEDGIILIGDVSPDVSYSDVILFEGYFPGIGNINSDPLFNNTDNDDYSLQVGSPCIDAGNPGSRFDPDGGTTSDMGAIYFHQAPAIPILLSPVDSSVLFTNPTLSWSKLNSTPNVDSYHLQVSTAPDFSILAVDESDITGTSFEVTGLANETTYFWRVNAANIGGTSGWSTVWSVTTISLPVGIDQSQNVIPKVFALKQNYPNPFNPSTTIEFDLPKRSKVILKILNILGMEISTVTSETLSPGRYTVLWNATGFASGVYIYHIQAGDFIETKKLFLMK